MVCVNPVRTALVSGVVIVLSSLSAVAAGEESGLAIFDFELMDTSLDGELRGPDPAEQTRLESLAPQLRAALAHQAGYRIVDIAPVAAQAHAANLQACGGCDTALAGMLGARFSVTGTVQKVSNLILNINVYVRDVADVHMVAAASADIRSNSDESWRRGLDWLIRHRLKAGLEAARP